MADHVLDTDTPLDQDPASGTRIGRCEVICHLSLGEPRSLLAYRFDAEAGAQLVVLRQVVAQGDVLQRSLALATTLDDARLGKVYGTETSDDGTTFWVSEFVGGATLEQIRASCKQQGTTFPMGIALPAIHDAAVGLQKLHAAPGPDGKAARAVHGFVHARNIIMTFSGSAKLLQPGHLWATDVAARHGELPAPLAGYLAPEAIRNELLDPRADVFSLGVMLHESLTGRPLFTSKNPQDRLQQMMGQAPLPPSSLNPAIDKEIDGVVLKALKVDRAARYANAGELARALKTAAGAFMMRESQRAEFVTRLFPVRHASVQKLTEALPKKEAEFRAAEAAAEAARKAEEARQAEEARRAEEARLAEEAAAAARKAELERQAAARAGAPTAPPTLTPGQTAAVTARGRVLSAARPAGRRPTWVIAAVAAVVLAAGTVAAIAWVSGDAPPPLAVAAADAGVDAGVDAGPADTDGGPAGALAGALDASVLLDGGEPATDGGVDEGEEEEVEEDEEEGEEKPKKKKKRRKRRPAKKKRKIVVPPWLQ